MEKKELILRATKTQQTPRVLPVFVGVETIVDDLHKIDRHKIVDRPLHFAPQ